MGPVVSGPVRSGDGLGDVTTEVAGDVGVGVGVGFDPPPLLPVHPANNPTIRAIASNRVATPK